MSLPPAVHGYSYETLVNPSWSSMGEVSAVRVSPTWGLPLMPGWPVASRIGAAATATVAALVRVSWWFRWSGRGSRALRDVTSPSYERENVAPVASGMLASTVSSDLRRQVKMA